MQPQKTYKYLTLLCMFYLTADLLSLVLTYKFIQFGSIFLSTEALVFPLTYTITDIIAEVYGYAEARRIIWLVFLCDFIFALSLYFLIQIPSPNQHIQSVYHDAFSSLLRGTIAEVVGVLAGIFINIYAISKLKIFTRGKYFWLRSIGSSLIGEAILVIISMPILFSNVVSGSNLVKIIVFTYSYKIIFAITMALPATAIVMLLKRKENVDVYDHGVNFNPFELTTTPIKKIDGYEAI